jgi:hypothetical protein
VTSYAVIPISVSDTDTIMTRGRDRSADSHATTARCELHRVRQQVKDDLPDPALVSTQEGKLTWDIRREAGLPFSARAVELIRAARDDAADIDLLFRPVGRNS